MLLYHLFLPVLLAIFVVFVDCRPNSKVYRSYSIPPGVVPVFIRSGDKPLKDIDQDLADAFDFNAQKHGRLAYGRPLSDLLGDKSEPNNNKLSDDNFIDSEIKSDITHIQKIPKV
ncbi:hypothetical protein GWI33_004059 [Rhynchophorus ferrugineus]|uniref:Uncharacterized protein n=1 Tax=Rhynchophorus ferrugineus TaxID=354439 RepID=A0A834IJ89_RHYFE|nr:hypothetical protein GWI33_004059 [Rhynchophorus ferrugineus]